MAVVNVGGGHRRRAVRQAEDGDLSLASSGHPALSFDMRCRRGKLACRGVAERPSAIGILARAQVRQGTGQVGTPAPTVPTAAVAVCVVTPDRAMDTDSGRIGRPLA